MCVQREKGVRVVLHLPPSSTGTVLGPASLTRWRGLHSCSAGQSSMAPVRRVTRRGATHEATNSGMEGQEAVATSLSGSGKRRLCSLSRGLGAASRAFFATTGASAKSSPVEERCSVMSWARVSSIPPRRSGPPSSSPRSHIRTRSRTVSS